MKNEIDKIDGMVKIKGKCGYEFIGGCRELRKAKAKLEKIKEFCNYCSNVEHSGCALCKYDCEEPTAFILSIIEGAEE